ncbi:MAG: triphosphoribosyl-dephospho-CoA synthase [Candidatus Nezhaarchaeota archaeon]|nr:triphosphoribosyl-dephospho-CoA synthase [Candidatus Nezhaarchaeota archaeon]
MLEHEVVLFADDVMRAGQLAAALEASAYPKPGNVHRLSEYPHKRFEHFVAGSIAIGPALREAAIMGASVGLHQLGAGGVGVGRLVKRAVVDMVNWQRGGNTHLGTILLLVPLAAGAGLAFASGRRLEPQEVRRGAVEVVRGATVEDAVRVYEAIAIASPGGLGVFEGVAPDVADPAFEAKLRGRGLTLLKVMEEASRWDSVAYELSHGFEATFNIALPALQEALGKAGDLRLAIVQSYLLLLASRPDTFIARCVGTKAEPQASIPRAVEAGMRAAEEVMQMAREALELGGALSDRGLRRVEEMDRELKSRGEDYNPGSTADIVTAALFIAILCGERP